VTSAPRLSVVSVVAGAESRLEEWVARACEYADELVLGVDEASRDATLDIAGAHADQVVTFAHPHYAVEEVRDALCRRATGEWILMLDDDEVMHAAFPERLDTLLGDLKVTHYWQAVRWLAPRPDGHGTGWIRQFPWWPNRVLRLFRNIGSLWWHAGLVHSSLDAIGEGGILDDDRDALWHLDFLLRDRAAREAKVTRYGVGSGPSCEEYYLWEDAAPIALADFDTATVLRRPSAAGLASAARRRDRVRSAAPKATEHWGREVYDVSAEHLRGTDVFGACYLSHTTPSVLRAGQQSCVEVQVRNDSPQRWRAVGVGAGRVDLAHRWEPVEAGDAPPATKGLARQRPQPVALLPRTVGPGEEVAIAAAVTAPEAAGSYRLTWSMRSNGRWFTAQGTAALSVPVEVTTRAPGGSSGGGRLATGDRPPEATVAAGAAEARQAWRPRPEPTSPGRQGMGPGPGEISVLALRPERLLDTRNGSGVPGAPLGPIPAGRTLELRVAGEHGVPDHAVAVVATLAVIDADYDGTVEIAGPDGTRAGLPFRADGGPVAATVIASISGGDLPGLVAIRPSDAPAGDVQLLLDVFGYLA